VGAFWKNNQRGERLITIAGLTSGYTGAWTAKVVSGKDWIILDRGIASTDTYVPYAINATTNMKDMLNTTVDEEQSLPSTTTTTSVSLSSTPSNTIQFRIGLKERLAAGASPRYGLIILSYNNNTKFHPIFIRQGEQPDYLFRNNNAEDAYSGTQRTKSVKFSPYNLTDPLGYVGSTTASLYTQLPVGSKTVEEHFTAYPSQAGYFFQWAGERRAFHPDNQPAGFSIPGSTNTFWSTTYETCPTGYRHPNDGPTDVIATGIPAQSEARESLYLFPITGSTSDNRNSCWGYYADGFFDRRARNTPPGYGTIIASSCVSYHSTTAALNKYVAYIGVVAYNPITLASIFWPAAGQRATKSVEGVGIPSDGALEHAGYQGNLYTSTKSNTINHMGTHIRGTKEYGVSVWHSPNSCDSRPMFMVRCVKI
jgi:hypothetical protein